MNEDTKVKTFNEVWLENYLGKSTVASTIMNGLKKTYKGDSYIPWSRMVSALYSLDPNAEIVKEQNDWGGFIFTDTCELRLTKGNDVTVQTVFSHMVKVKVLFMGKWFTENYPIQDNDYSASKNYDQNKVNKALQRCLARTISMATGVGWSLYEQLESQFDDDKDAPTIKPSPKVAIETVTSVEKAVATGDPVKDLANLMFMNKENDKVTNIVANFNTVLSKQYLYCDEPLIIDLPNDTIELLVDKLKVVAKPDKMLASLNRVLGL